MPTGPGWVPYKPGYGPLPYPNSPEACSGGGGGPSGGAGNGGPSDPVDPLKPWKDLLRDLATPDWTWAIGPLGIIGKGGKFWKALKPFRGKTKTDGTGKRYEWDYTHNDVEVYNKRGQHLGSADPETGAMIKPPVPGRKIGK